MGSEEWMSDHDQAVIKLSSAVRGGRDRLLPRDPGWLFEQEREEFDPDLNETLSTARRKVSIPDR